MKNSNTNVFKHICRLRNIKNIFAPKESIPWEGWLRREGNLRNSNSSIDWQLELGMSYHGHDFVFFKKNYFCHENHCLNSVAVIQRLKIPHRKSWFVLTTLWGKQKTITLTMTTQQKHIRFAQYLHHRHGFQFSTKL